MKSLVAPARAGILLAFGAGLVLHLLHAGAHEAHALPPVLHWLRDSSLAVPGTIAVLAIVLPLARGTARWAGLEPGSGVGVLLQALAGGLGYALFSIPAGAVHARLFGAEHAGTGFVAHAVRDGGVAFLAAFTILAALPLLTRGAAALLRALLVTRPSAPVLGGLAAALAGAVVLTGVGPVGPGIQAAIGEGGPCPSDARVVTYDVSAFQNVIPLNGWGDHLPDGLMYGLKNDGARNGKAAMVADPKKTQPLVVRANVGDCVKIKLRNDIAGRRIGMHTDGLVRANPRDSDGARVGNNPDSTVATGAEITYTYYADKTGEAVLADIANLDGNDPQHPTIQRGLYGALIVHPKGSTWHNQLTGEDLLDQGTNTAVETQVFADVRVPDGQDFRSLAMVFLDENEGVKDKDGNQPTFPTTGLADSTFGINYRSEPLRNRLRAILEHRGTVTPENPNGTAKTIRLPNGKVYEPSDHFCDGYVPSLGKVVEDPGAKCMGEESHLQSWIFGDEGKLVGEDAKTISDNLIPKAYKGDPVKFHMVHPGAKETHPWHQHTQRWQADPNKANSPLNDVQSIAPGEARLLDIEGGAGGTQGTIGDTIFHCHLYPHFAQGFWGHLRVFDRLRDGSQKLPDGTELERLQELPDRSTQTPAPTAEHPGFPLFVEGDLGQRAYKAPNGVIKDDFKAIRRPGDTVREPTALEKANMPGLDATKPGAGYVDPCPSTAPVRTYKPHAIDMPITYNSAGWKDKQGRVYVEESHKAGVLDGTRKLEPYTIRAKIGDCVQVQTTNDLHLDDDPSKPVDHLNKMDGEYMQKAETSEISTHVHLVKFDELASDGTSVGWNYVQAAMPGQTYGYRWFVDTALRTVFFHDHQYANLHQQKGLFAALNVEPADASWHDPRSGAATDGVGTVADIRTPSGPDFREMTVFHQDRAPMWRDHGAGAAVEPPGAPDDFGADQGGVAFNYRNEPFQIRVGPNKEGLRKDPAYTYSSAVHGDPSTPTFRAYNGDPVVVRNVVGAHEEMHTFNVHGHRWLSEPDNPDSAKIDSQSLSLAEYFNYEVEGGTVTHVSESRTATLAKARNASENGAPKLVEGGAGAPGDYLYGSQPLDDQWLGLWGIFRVPAARVSDLQPLPDRSAPPGGDAWPAVKPGNALTKAPEGGQWTTCPSTAPARTYNVSAIRTDIVYNKDDGDHDPNGLMYVLAEDEAAVKAGTKRPEPLFIRANSGDCVKVVLTNKLPAGGLPDHDGDVPLPADSPFPKSNRVSMHPSLVNFDPTRSDGATVGYNYDQTIAPGETITYTWYAKAGVSGATNLADFGDRRGHRHHGLFGGLIIEPQGATWTHPKTGEPVKSGAEAVIRWTDASGPRATREFVLDWQDGLNLRRPDGSRLPEAEQMEEPYERGHRGINYRTERFGPRLAKDPEQANVLSSVVHGDPETPVLRSYVGDPVTVRLLQGSDRGRAHSFLLHGHGWNNQPNDARSMVRHAANGLMPGRAFNLGLIGGAGGLQQAPGDYLFRDGLLNNQVNAGLWGLLRVHGAPEPDLKPLG